MKAISPLTQTTHAAIGGRRGSCGSRLTLRKMSDLTSLVVAPPTTAARQRQSSVSLSTSASQRVSAEQTMAFKKSKQTTANQTENIQQVLKRLPSTIRAYVEQKARLTNCAQIHICDGSDLEAKQMIELMKSSKINIKALNKYENNWLVTTDPRDTARVESKTFICTRNAADIIPSFVLSKSTTVSQQIVHNSLGNWMHIDYLDARLEVLLRNCMSGKTMFVLPFSMGKIGGKLSKVGIQLTDSPYVVASMRIMTRVSLKVFDLIENASSSEDVVRCFHSSTNHTKQHQFIISNQSNTDDEQNKFVWPCDPENAIISHIPERNEIISYGSNYGGNSLLGKKCFALRFGTILGCKQNWLAEHMLILSITQIKTGIKKYIAAAFPSACGKTNLAMLNALPEFGYQIKTCGDDILWLRRDGKIVRGMNPESGFFGVAPGTSERTNPNAMATIQRNSIFTNVAFTSDGDFYWRGLEHKLTKDTKVTSWTGKQNWTLADKEDAAHPNSRFCAPITQCPTIDDEFEEEVPISAILFGTRRPDGVPLVYEAFNWEHGVYLGASMRSETTAAAADHAAGKSIVFDPMAQRPFLGVKFTEYLQNWLNFAHPRTTDINQNNSNNVQMPRIFHVNWFRKDPISGEFLWPGFAENTRVLDFIFQRLGEQVDDSNLQSQLVDKTPIGFVPKVGVINTTNLQSSANLTADERMKKLLAIDTDFWLKEQAIVDEYLRLNEAPADILKQGQQLRERLLTYK